MSKILVLEQDPSLQRLYRQELGREGDIVVTAGDSAEVVRDFEIDRPDLVVLDLGPPPNDGLRIVERMLALDRTVPIVLNATYRGYDDDPLGWAVDAYLVKSSDTDELRSAVSELLAPCRLAPGAPTQNLRP